MFGKWTETDCHTQLQNINHVGNEAKDNPQKVTRPKPCKPYDDDLAAHLREVINIYPHFSSNIAKFTLEQAMKAQRWRSHIALLFL